jgi:hypothetical protein
MSTPHFSLSHINALQRAELDAAQALPTSALKPCQVRPERFVQILSLPQQDSMTSHAVRTRSMADALAGLAVSDSADHLVFVASGSGSGIRIGIAVTDRVGRSAPDANLRSVLTANLQGVELTTTGFAAILPEPNGVSALMVGTPAPTLPEAPDDPGPLDRLFGGLSNVESSESWVWSVVAQRLSCGAIAQRLAGVLAELRAVADDARGVQPVAVYYKQLLESVADKLTVGRSVGMWSVTTVINANSDALLQRARGLAQSVYSGQASKPDPVRVLPLESTPALPTRFDALATRNLGPELWLGAYTSLLHTSELATLVGVPRLERPGFEIRRAPRFKQSLPTTTSSAFDLGEILDRGTPTGSRFLVDPAGLTSHTLVAGTSGSGKTNSVFHILRALTRSGVPFLVIEPSKTEYRSLLEDSEIGPRLVVHTLGQEMIAPFRLNPFEVPEGIAVQTHLDRMKALFNASFTMYAPMPQVLERCLTEVYEDRGWDLLTNLNRRGSGAQAFPTLGDLFAKIDEVVPKLGYEQRITADVSAALRTRIDSLRIGAKGSMLDTAVSANIGNLLNGPAILELDAIGDDDEKAFLVGLFFNRLAEEQLLNGPTGGKLRHVTVIEEAHRLFLNVPLVGGSEVGNPKGKAVETFCNILSEIRAFGEGVIVVDQIPTRLAPDTLKNTSLKLMHRLPASDDREALGRTMAQNTDQIEAGVALHVGVALVYAGGQNGSFEVAVPRAPLLGEPVQKRSSDLRVREAMHRRYGAGFSPGNVAVNLREVQALRRSDDLQEQAIRWIQSVAVSPISALDVLVPLFQMVARLNSQEVGVPAATVLREVLRTTLRDCAGAAGWPYEEVSRAEASMLLVYDDTVECFSRKQPSSTEGDQAKAEFVANWSRLGGVDIYPHPHCHTVCPEFLCRYRFSARRLAEREPLRSAWVRALNNHTDMKLWNALTDVVDRAVERGLSHTATAVDRRRIAACFVQHSLEQDRVLEPSLRDKVFANVLTEIDLRLSATPPGVQK